MRLAVGRELSRRVSFPIAESDVRRWVLAVYYPEQPPPAWRELFAAGGSNSLPALVPEEFNPFAWAVAYEWPEIDENSEVDADRIETLLGIDGPGLVHQINGGVDVAYELRIYAGDVITSANRLRSYQEKIGQLGRMLITVTEDTWTNQRGETVKRTLQTTLRY